jgi:hypothetical protein
MFLSRFLVGVVVGRVGRLLEGFWDVFVVINIGFIFNFEERLNS